MKKALAALLLLLALVGAFHAGKVHTIKRAELFVVSLPERNEKGGFDESEITVYLDIDGDIHEYGANIG